MNKGKGSETATGDMPVSSGRSRSRMVKTFDGGLKLMCCLGSKALLFGSTGTNGSRLTRASKGDRIIVPGNMVSTTAIVSRCVETV